MSKVAILGFGTVGSGVYEIIKKNHDSIARKVGKPVELGRIVDIRDFPGHEAEKFFTKDFNCVLNDPEIDIVTEVIGGLHPAYEFTKQLLEAGKSVVTSNKELVATHGAELLAIAKEHGVHYMFEASVGGGIPIIRPMHQCLAANEISEIIGILNGTTNYILTEMFQKGKSFETALKDAQEKGYAEANPAADVEGKDACRKIAILSSLSFGYQVDAEKIPTEGITKITLDDVKLAESMGYVIKLIGCSKRMGDKIMAYVSPVLIPENHSLAGVVDVFNAIMIQGDSIGDVMFYGRGAGKLPTASAVMADVIDCARNEEVTHPIIWKKSDKDILERTEENECAMYVRLNRAAAQQVKEVFGDVEFYYLPGDDSEVAFITEKMKEGEFHKKIAGIQGVQQMMRVRCQD